MLKGAVLYAKSLECLTKFYTALGGQLIESSDGEFAIVGHKEAELIILQTPEEIASQIVIERPPIVRSTTPIKPIFQVSSLPSALNTLSDCGGATLPGANQSMFRQHLVQDIVDPEGNVVQLWQQV